MSHDEVLTVAVERAISQLKSIDITIEFADPVIPDYDDTSLEERRKFATHIRAKIHDMYLRINPFYSGNETFPET